MFKLQLSSKYSPFDAIHLSRCFSTAQNRFLNFSILMPFSTSALFCFTSPTLAKCFPLRTFLSRETQKSHWAEFKRIRRVGHGGHDVFGQKVLNTQHGVGRCTPKSSIMKWVTVLKVFKKKFTEAKRSLSQQHQLVH